MSVRHRIGRSEMTQIKHLQLREILRAHLRIVGAIRDKWSFVGRQYCYIETCAGMGLYEDGTKGSPVLFLEEARAASVNYLCQFIEESPRNCKRLRLSVNDDYCTVHHGRYQDIIGATRISDASAYGLLFCDPNGSFDEASLAKFSQLFPHIDILIYVNGSGIKRGSRVHGHSRIKEKLSAIGKEHWAIRGPQSKWQFSFALGTNWKPLLKKFERLDMYDINNMAGHSYLDRLERTNAERIQDVQGILEAPTISVGEEDRLETCCGKV